MNTNDFALWLSGFVELHKVKPNDRQWSIITDHLNLALGKKPTEPLERLVASGSVTLSSSNLNVPKVEPKMTGTGEHMNNQLPFPNVCYDGSKPDGWPFNAQNNDFNIPPGLKTC